MRKLIWQLVLPLTVISFALVTKWWYVLPKDAPDTMFWGFPFVFVGEAWHTSMACQFFVLELFADALIYFLASALVVFAAARVFNIKGLPNSITWTMWIVASVFFSIMIIPASSHENIFELTRDFKMEVMDSGGEFIWQSHHQHDYNKYHPEKRGK